MCGVVWAICSIRRSFHGEQRETNGNREGARHLEILLDYTAPQYRDCSVGQYLYGELGGQGISKLSFPEAPEGHVEYLQKVGFVKQNGVYERWL